MEVISIIVSDDECPVISIETFGVLDEEHKSQAVEEAENCFVETAVKWKFGNGTNTTREDLNERNFYREECQEALEDGYIHIYPHTVSIVWSSIDNIQL